MTIRQNLKVTRKTFFNPSGWLNYALFKEQNRTIWTVIKAMFVRPKPLKQETFAEALTRLNLTDADAQSLAKTYRHYAWFFLIIGIVSFFYSFYLLFATFAFFDWILGLCVTTLSLSQAFRYDFWGFQIRRRQLGITITEWKQSILGDKGTSS